MAEPREGCLHVCCSNPQELHGKNKFRHRKSCPCPQKTWNDPDHTCPNLHCMQKFVQEKFLFEQAQVPPCGSCSSAPALDAPLPPLPLLTSRPRLVCSVPLGTRSLPLPGRSRCAQPAVRYLTSPPRCRPLSAHHVSSVRRCHSFPARRLARRSAPCHERCLRTPPPHPPTC